jgi:hypothetical protein
MSCRPVRRTPSTPDVTGESTPAAPIRAGVLRKEFGHINDIKKLLASFNVAGWGALKPEQYDHIWEGGYATVLEGAYYAKSIAEARAQGRIGKVAADPLMTRRIFCDIGGTGAKADAFTMWVAQFIGTPQMNQMPAALLDVSHDADGATVARFHLLGEDIAAVVEPGVARLASGSSVTLGVRPRSFAFVPTGTRDALHGKVDLIEPMGAEVLLHVVERGADLRCVVPHTTRVVVGQAIALACKPGQLHVFDAEGKLMQ